MALPDVHSPVASPHSAVQAPFYSAANLRAEDSIGYLLKSVLSSIRSVADAELQGRGLTFAQCLPLYNISL